TTPLLLLVLSSPATAAARFSAFATATTASTTLTCNLPAGATAGQYALFAVSFFGSPNEGPVSGGTCIATYGATQLPNSPQIQTASYSTTLAVYGLLLGGSPPSTCT